MRFLTYIKSHNETLIIAVIAIVIAIPVIFLSTNNEATKNLADKPEWTTSTTTSIDIHGYTIKFERKFTKDANNKDKILETGITLSKGGKNVFIKKSKGNDWESFYAIGGEYNQIDSADDIKKFAIKDLNKNGVPELVFAVFSGGFHCCSQDYIIELSDPISFLLDLDTGNQIIGFRDLNNDGIMEIETSEDVFTYWNTSYGASPMSRVVLSIQDGVYKANSALMREPPPTDAVLQKKASVIESWSGAAGPEVAWVYAIDLIYSGNISSAKKYVDLAWRNDGYGAFKTKEEFWRELVDRIVQSPYFSDLSSYLGLDDMVNASVEQVCDNYGDIQKFEKPIPIVWTAKLDGCLMSCYGASFTRVPSDEKYPRFAGYYPDMAGKYNWDIDTNGNAGGSQIPEDFRKDSQILKVYGNWTSVDADHPYTVFENKCVPIIEIDKIEILDDSLDSLTWTIYDNKHFGYTVIYPTSWLPKEEAVNGDGRTLYKEGGDEIIVYGKIINPEYPDDFVGDGRLVLEEPFKLANGEEGTLLNIYDSDHQFRYIMYVDHKIESDMSTNGYYEERYVLYASVSDYFARSYIYILHKMAENFTPPPPDYNPLI